MRRRDKRILPACLGIFVAVSLLTFLLGRFKSNNADAADLSKFDPGYIISDYTMSNYNSMTEAEIQAFLTKKNPCSNRDYDLYQRLSANNPNVSWHWKDGHFVCLSEELFGDGMTIGEGKTAAKIIYETAQEYKINPQVLIVLIEKESSLITDTIPNNYDYRTMTGFGCPDTAPCDAKYFGFKNQIRKAAWLFREVLDGGWTNYPLGENYVQYNPNAGCGGSIVNIRSLATSALYRYTPYQPNAGALAAGTGTAYCGAYGNRNFYIYFENWFGGITDEKPTTSTTKAPKNKFLNGIYNIRPESSIKENIDIAGGIYEGIVSGRATLFRIKGEGEDTRNQEFAINYDPVNKYYYIFNNESGLYLDSSDNELIFKQKNESSCGQKWNIELSSEGHYFIKSVCKEKNLGATDASGLELTTEDDVHSWWIFEEVYGGTPTLADGIYSIASVMAGDGYVMDIKGGISKTSQTGELEIWRAKKKSEGIDNQVFKVAFDKNTGYYSITNPLSGLSVDVSGGGIADGTKIIMWSTNGGCNQKWSIVPADDNKYEIISACSKKTIGISEEGQNSGKGLSLFSRNGSSSQQWVFKTPEQNDELEGDYSILSAANSGIAIDISGGISSNMQSGKAIVFSKKNSDNDNQTFAIKKDSRSSYYYIYNKTSNLYLDVSGGRTSDGAEVIFWPFNGGCNQKWEIIKNENNGFYRITSSCSNKALDIRGGSTKSNTPLIIFYYHGGDNQEWILQKQ